MAEVVSGIEKTEDADKLILTLRKGNYIERMNAIEQLKISKDEKAIVPLIFALNGADDLYRSIIEALIIMGDMAIGPMLDYWPWLYIETQKFLIDIIKTIGSEKAIEALISLLNDRKNQARPDAALALGRIGGKKAVEPLIKALSDDSFAVRIAAYQALDGIDTKDIDLAAIAREVETQCVKMEVETLDVMRKLSEKRTTEPVSVTVSKGGTQKLKSTIITLLDRNEANYVRYTESQLSFAIYVWRMMKIAQKR